MKEIKQGLRRYTIRLRRTHPAATWQVSVENAVEQQTARLDGLDNLLAYFGAELTRADTYEGQSAAAIASGMNEAGA